jgi:hypothetical protein
MLLWCGTGAVDGRSAAEMLEAAALLEDACLADKVMCKA